MNQWSSSGLLQYWVIPSPLLLALQQSCRQALAASSLGFLFFLVRLLWGYFIQLKTNFLVLKMKTRVLLFSRENVLTKYEQKRRTELYFCLLPALGSVGRKMWEGPLALSSAHGQKVLLFLRTNSFRGLHRCCNSRTDKKTGCLLFRLYWRGGQRAPPFMVLRVQSAFIEQVTQAEKPPVHSNYKTKVNLTIKGIAHMFLFSFF